MKPVIAVRTTICYECRDPIEPGSRRLSDVFRVRPRGRKSILVRRHFHYDRPGELGTSCFNTWSEKQFDGLERNEISNNPNGRPPLGLSKEDMTERTKLLRKVHNQIDYYIIKGHLDLSSPKYITDISVTDVRKAEKFVNNIKNALTRLSELGGVPPKYQGYWSSIEKEVSMSSEV
jgi:hypothetical protein